MVTGRQNVRIQNFRVSIDEQQALETLVSVRLRIEKSQIGRVRVIRKALDARRERNICFVYTLAVEIPDASQQILKRWRQDRDISLILPVSTPILESGMIRLHERPVVIGFGPAGMFAALTLARHGFRPLVLERGAAIEQRQEDVQRFWDRGILDETSNVQFGEGGAGTFSDGKLTTRVNDPLMESILQDLVEAGAPGEILYWYKPHVGTDRLRSVVRNLRQQIERLGGEILFRQQVTDLRIEAGTLQKLTVNDQTQVPCELALLGIGHSARDTYAMLYKSGVAMESKPFSIGVRIEHPQDWIDRSQYGLAVGHPALTAADYSLVFHDKIMERTVYSFCMCPGGVVIGAASEAGGVVVNGMSHYQRASGTANSALAVTVDPADFGEGVLAGIDFQRRFERLAYDLGGRSYYAPVQTVGGFLNGSGLSQRCLSTPTYGPGVAWVQLEQCLPGFASASLKAALPDFGRRIKGFDHPEAVLTGVETRTSAPLRILRGIDGQSVNVKNLYPMGEGAGYAGGIMSAAIDGVKAAQQVIQTYRPA